MRRVRIRCSGFNSRVPSRGFTLVEFLVVIVVIGILAAIAIPVFLSQADKASDTSLKSDLANAAKLLQVAEANGETLPSEITAGEVVDLGSAGTFTSNQTLTVSGSGESLCVEGVSGSGDTYSAGLTSGLRNYDCAGYLNGDLADEGLVLHLDAGNPQSYPGDGDTWFDLSGNSNHASLSGTYEYVPGQSFLFNEGAQIDGDGRATVDFGVVESASAYTIETVFRVNRYKFVDGYTNISVQLFSSGRTPGNYDKSFYLGSNYVTGEVQNAGMAWYHNNNADGPGGCCGHRRILAGETYVATVTIETPGTVRFYLNGELKSTNTTTACCLRVNNVWSVGNQPPGHDQGFDSNFYSLRVYDRVLSADEVALNADVVRDRYNF